MLNSSWSSQKPSLCMKQELCKWGGCADLQGEPAFLMIGVQTCSHWENHLPLSSAVTTQYEELLSEPLSPGYKLSPFNFLCVSSLGRWQHQLLGPSLRGNKAMSIVSGGSLEQGITLCKKYYVFVCKADTNPSHMHLNNLVLQMSFY